MSHPPLRQSAFADSLASALPPLKRDEIRSYINLIDSAVDNALCLINGLGNIRWQPVKQKGDVVISRAADDLNSLSNQAAVRSVCSVNASFDEMLDHLITETTESFRERESTLHGAEFLDGAVLHVLHPREYAADYSSQRYVCIKWHCLKAVAAPTKPRDYVYVEVVGSFVDDQNVRIGYCLSKSIDLKHMPSFDDRYVRAKTFTLHTFHGLDSVSRSSTNSSGSSPVSPLNSFQVELRSMVLGDYNGRLPAWVVNKMSDLAALRGQSIRDYFEQMRLSTIEWVHPHQYVPASKRAFCVVCTRGFSLVRKKYNCQACGDVVCSQCSLIQLIGPKKVKTRVCIACNMQARTNQLNPHQPRPSTVSSRPSNSSLPSPHHGGNYNGERSNNRGSIASLASTARASERTNGDSLYHSNSLSADWPPTQPQPYPMRRSQSEMPPTSDHRSSMGPFTPSRESHGRVSSEHHRFTNGSTARTMSISSNTSSIARPSAQDATQADDQTNGAPQREGLDLGVSHFKQTVTAPPLAGIVPLPPHPTMLQPLQPPQPPQPTVEVDVAALGMDLDVSILHMPSSSDLGRLSEALSDMTARNSEQPSERMSELDVDAYDDEFDDFKVVHHEDVLLEEPSTSEVSLDFASFVEPAIVATVQGGSTDGDEEPVDDDFDDDFAYRPSHMAAEDYLEATRMTLAEITRGMVGIQESTELNAQKLEEQEQEQVRMSVMMDFNPMADTPKSQSTVVVPPPRASVMDTPPDVENLFVVLKLNAEIDRLQQKMENVQEGSIQLNHVNEAMNEKIQTLEKIESKKVLALDEVTTPTNDPTQYLVHTFDKITNDLKQIQENMEKVQETAMAIDVKLEKDAMVEVPMLPESVRGGFVSFLEDSSFVPATTNDEDATPDGWTSVHSKVTGKMYYYNASCGQTSWTMPEDDDLTSADNYAVL
ncbi:Aste57867_20557 [Aphanomyces stellatus]|uniref:Aste57867_20557 protein n=1 Tax=Aphanomyces stellatus TaxID=120398 RepID=A0A485LGF2_9STRA|nr:hypothetical protein As57867_020490 [Aphanomyces stellatus]VFT97241.1 Aste57867_20557 [Aphanomyces stellatus]